MHSVGNDDYRVGCTYVCWVLRVQFLRWFVCGQVLCLLCCFEVCQRGGGYIVLLQHIICAVDDRTWGPKILKCRVMKPFDMCKVL